MSSISEYDFVASEITELEQLLDTISVDRVLDRSGLETRLRKARASLTTLSPPELPTPVNEAQFVQILKNPKEILASELAKKS